MNGGPGYRTLTSRLRANVRSLISKHLEQPKQEIAEIVRANLQAAKWFAIAAAFGFIALIAFVVLVVALLALVLPLWASALVVMATFGLLAALAGLRGARKVELHGPTRSIASFKETVQWAKTRLLGRSGT